jgi:glutamate synthase (NADPH/NADH) large chain
MVIIDCAGKTIREINTEIKTLAKTEPELRIINPEARHLLAVGLIGQNRLTIEGSAGYFCGALTEGPSIEVTNNAGWCLGENMMSGELLVRKNAGSQACSALRGSTVVIYGNAGSRVGQVMKAGTIILQGNAGYMVGFMMLGGKIVVVGDVGDSLAEFIIRGEIYVGGKIPSLGHDAIQVEASQQDLDEVHSLLERYQVKPPKRFKKIISAQKLQKYAKREY